MGNPEKHVTIKEEPEEAKIASPGNPPWDAEEDHLLSYFLDADAVARHRSNSDASLNRSPRMRPSVAPPDQTEGTAAPTMTPAVHFYASAPQKEHQGHQPPQQPLPPPVQPHQQAQQQPVVPESSLSSMASMAAALVGGPVFPNPNKEEETTISPASDLIKGTHENLMLPPAAHGQPSEAEKQQHLAWLQQINAMAAMARHQPVPNGVPMSSTTGPGMPPPPAAAGTAAAVAAAPHGYPPLPPHHHQHHPLYAPMPAAETEEKRARRLARNRESARQSRRRKKERLATLEQQVTTLFGQVESQRRDKMMEMESQLQTQRTEGIATMMMAATQQQQQQHQPSSSSSATTTTTVAVDQSDSSLREELQQLLQGTSPNNVVRERVANFQYEKMRQLLLPRHEEFLLWLSLQSHDFFNAAKEHKASALASNKAGRVSSKQIGEELTNEAKRTRKQNIEDDEDKVSSVATDVDRMWPLLCFELLVSVDQEERLLQTQKRSMEMPNLPNDRLEMALATKMATNLRKGVLFQAHAASMRTNTALLDILTPEQSIKYLQWMSANRDKCREAIQEGRRNQRRKGDDDDVMNKETATLSDICKRLDEVLRFPKGDGADNIWG